MTIKVEQDAVELLPCPFCGELPNMWTHKNRWSIDCETEDCINPGTPIVSEKTRAITKWNTRTNGLTRSERKI